MVLKPKEIVFPTVLCGGDLNLPYSILGDSKEYRMEERHFYRSLQGDREREWRKIVARYEADHTDFFNAYDYLDHHPAFYAFYKKAAEYWPHERWISAEGGVKRCFDVMVVKVTPRTERISDTPSRNTKTQVWVEFGKSPWPGDDCFEVNVAYHDYMLDTGGETFEEAMIKAAYNTWVAYGNDRRVCDGPYDESAYDGLPDEFADRRARWRSILRKEEK